MISKYECDILTNLIDEVGFEVVESTYKLYYDFQIEQFICNCIDRFDPNFIYKFHKNYDSKTYSILLDNKNKMSELIKHIEKSDFRVKFKRAIVWVKPKGGASLKIN